LEKIKHIIDEVASAGAQTIALLGGDPVLHPQFVDIAKHVKRKGMRVTCMSNTMAIHVYEPEQLVDTIDGIDTTIHGANAEEHDNFCKCEGAYDSLTMRLRKYADLGVAINIVVNIIPQTYNKIYEIVSGIISRHVNVQSLLTQRILPFGRARNTSEYDVDAAQVNIAFNQIERIVRDFHIDISVEDPYPLCCIEKPFWRFMHGCPEGFNRIAINMDGDISRCGAVPDYSVGNVFLTPIDEIWKTSEAFNAVRNCNHLVLQECKECTHQKQCYGGCPVSCEICNSTKENFIAKFKEGY
jgi:radical SAM protein with 4Fe4S-binding SPASM domain